MSASTHGTFIPADLVAAFEADKVHDAALGASPQGRYVAAMRLAWHLGIETASIAKAAMDMATRDWESGLLLPASLAKECGRSAAQAVTAAALAMVIADAA